VNSMLIIFHCYIKRKYPTDPNIHNFDDAPTEENHLKTACFEISYSLLGGGGIFVYMSSICVL